MKNAQSELPVFQELCNDIKRGLGAGNGSRTHDLLITNQLLWPLSYPGFARRDKLEQR